MIPPEYQIYKGFDQVKSLKRKEVIESGELYHIPPRVHYEFGKRELDITINEIREPYEEVEDGQYVRFKRDIMPDEKIVFTRSIFSRMIGGVELDTNSFKHGRMLIYDENDNLVRWEDVPQEQGLIGTKSVDETNRANRSIVVYDEISDTVVFTDDLNLIDIEIVRLDGRVDVLTDKTEQDLTDLKVEITDETDLKIEDVRNSKNEKINKLADDLDDLAEKTEQDLIDLKVEITSETDGKIVTVNQAISTLDTKVDDLGNKVEHDLLDLDEKITGETDLKIEDVRNSKNEKINKLADDLNSLTEKTEQDLTDLKTEITSETDTKITTINQAISNTNQAITNLDTKVDNLGNKVEQDLIDLKTEITSETDSKIVAVNQAISNVNQAVTNLDTKVDNLGNKVEQDLIDLKTEITGDTNVSTLNVYRHEPGIQFFKPFKLSEANQMFAICYTNRDAVIGETLIANRIFRR